MKQDHNKELGDVTVKAQNKLVSSKFKYTQCQMDLLFYILHVVKDNEKVYVFPMQNIAKLTGRQYHSLELKKQTAGLASKIFTIDEDDEKWSHTVLFQQITYDHGIVSVTLNDVALDLFKQTKSEFSYIELKSGLLLNKKYDKRLYWLLSQWRIAGRKEYKLDELRELLDLVDEKGRPQYSQPSELKILIDTTCKEISAITDINVEPVWMKTGRSFTSVLFNLSPNQKRLPLDQSDIDYNQSQEKGETLQYIKAYGFTDEQRMEMWDRGCRLADFKKIVADAKNAMTKTKIEDPAAYLVACVINAGYIRPKEKANLKEVIAENKRKEFNKKRKEMITLIKEAITTGENIASFKVMMDKFGITENDLQ